jgi:hypothetical protein
MDGWRMDSIVRRRMESYKLKYGETHRQLRWDRFLEPWVSILKPVRFDPAPVRLNPSVEWTIETVIKSTPRHWKQRKLWFFRVFLWLTGNDHDGFFYGSGNGKAMD